MTTDRTRIQYDGESDVTAWAVGSGIALIQACAVFPGLLPCLLLLLPLVLPLVVIAIPAGLLFGTWRLVRHLIQRGLST